MRVFDECIFSNDLLCEWSQVNVWINYICIALDETPTEMPFYETRTVGKYKSRQRDSEQPVPKVHITMEFYF